MKTIGTAVILFCICLVQKTEADDDCPAVLQNMVTFVKGLRDNGGIEEECKKYVCKKEDDDKPIEEKLKKNCEKMKNADDHQKECAKKMFIKMEEQEAGLSKKTQECVQKFLENDCNN